MEDLEISQLFKSVYKGKNVLITGHTGFKGSWLSLWLQKLGAKVVGFSLPAHTSPAHCELIQQGTESYLGNISDKVAFQNIVQKTKPDIIFHLAAQALVRDSYRNPSLTYETNVIGTLNIFEAIRNTPGVKALVNVTTDKVYDNKEWHWPYRETDALGGYDLYSSSKACSELLTASYRNSFFHADAYGVKHQLLIATARAGNVIGGGDWALDRLIPDMVRATAKNEVVEIRSPKSVRPWEHVLEPLAGYLLLGQKLLEGRKDFAEAWNFGPDSTHFLTVEDILNKANGLWPKMQWASHVDALNFHEAKILKLDCAKAHAELEWKPVWNMEETLQHTIEWYRNYYENGIVNTESDLHAFVRKAVQEKSSWTIL